MRPLATIATLLVASACAQPGSTSDAEAARPPSMAPEPPACRDRGAVDPLATLPGSPCAWILVEDASGLTLRSLDLEPPPEARGQPPPVCAETRCRFEGAETELGPLVLVIELSPHSEMPEGVHLGLIDGSQLRFVDLWAGAGESILGDSTPLGPPYALAPFSCEGDPGLFVEARLEAARGISPPPQLLAREGRLSFDGGEPVVAGTDRSGCDRVSLALP